MYVHDAVLVMTDEGRGEDAHETGQAYQADFVALELRNQRQLKALAGLEVMVVEGDGRDFLRFGPAQDKGVPAVADQDTDLGPERIPVQGLHDGVEVAAAARSEYTDIQPRHVSIVAVGSVVSMGRRGVDRGGHRGR